LHLCSSPLSLPNAFWCCLSLLHLNGSISPSGSVTRDSGSSFSIVHLFHRRLHRFLFSSPSLPAYWRPSTPGDVVITGDFDVHVGSGETNADDFGELLVSLSFSQLVKAPTRCAKSGKWHTLDLILTRESSNFVLDTIVTSRFSDHHAVQCSLNITSPPIPFKSATFRAVNSIDLDAFV
jgi:hypothetical protein